MRLSEQELIHAELEALKNSVVMLHVNEFGQVINRILVNKKDIQHFKNLGYAENIKEGYDPQIGHIVELKYINIVKEIEQKVIQKFSFFKKIKHYLIKLFRIK